MEMLTAREVDAGAEPMSVDSRTGPATGSQGTFVPPAPVNEPILDYAPGSPERASLKAELKRQGSEVVEIPLIIGGKDVRTAETFDVTMPHDHGHVIARCHVASEAEAEAAIAAARNAWHEWSAWPWETEPFAFSTNLISTIYPCRSNPEVTTRSTI